MYNSVISAFALISLSGCVGAWVEMPIKVTSKTPAHTQLTYREQTPVITRTVRFSEQREWCGTTVWALLVPIPLKLPVCHSYTEYAYGNDVNGREAELLYTQQSLSDPFYACGPFMFLGPLMHTYDGNALCGQFR